MAAQTIDTKSEALRQEALAKYAILDSPPEASFDKIVKVAARQFDVPIAYISLAAENRLWFKAACGVDYNQTERENTFTSHTIAGESVFIVLDAAVDPTFKANIAVLEAPYIRFYAGAPIKTANGMTIGALCLVDQQPRVAFSDEDRCRLLDLAEIVQSMLEARISAARVLTNGATHVDSALDQHRRFVESLRDGVMSCDQAGVFSVFNSAARHIYGLTEMPQALSDLLGNMEVFTVDGKRKINSNDAPLHRALRGETVDGEEFMVATTGQPVCVLRVTARPLLDSQGASVGAVSTLEDVTDARRLEERFRQAQKMEAVGQLTSGLAHDFNNLLAVVKGNLQLIERAIKDDPKALRRTEAALDATRRGADLTKRLLAFSRKQDLKPKTTIANDLLQGMEDMLTRTLGENVDLAIVSPNDDWQVLVDESEFESAVLNLCVNARDAMPDGGRLTIETKCLAINANQFAEAEDLPAGDYVRITVTDTGVGMSEDICQKVFEPFFTTKDVGKGSGLGLSMVYGFIKQSGGHISIYSEVGHGISISMYVPRHIGEEDALTSHAPAPVVKEVPAPAHRILVVEDNDAVREVATAMLADMGYSVIEAVDGLSALETLRVENGKFDLMFTDIVMPGGMNGPALAKEARAVFPNLPVLYTSGYADAAVMREGDIGNSVDLVRKPYRLEELQEKVRKALMQQDQAPVAASAG